MVQNTKTLIEEINELRNEVKMLRAIVQSLMYVIAEEQSYDMDFEEEIEEKDPLFTRTSVRRYVS